MALAQRLRELPLLVPQKGGPPFAVDETLPGQAVGARGHEGGVQGGELSIGQAPAWLEVDEVLALPEPRAQP